MIPRFGWLGSFRTAWFLPLARLIDDIAPGYGSAALLISRRIELRAGRTWILGPSGSHDQVLPPVSRICAIAVLLLASGGSVSATEKFAGTWTADAVVVGKLKLSSYFLSFDGVHVNGSILATEILFGSEHAGSEFAYHLVVPCSLWVGCDYRALWHSWSENKEIFIQGRIWALNKVPGSSWTSADGPQLRSIYDLTDREEVIAVLKRRKQHDAKP
jgi:hypothetical protein